MTSGIQVLHVDDEQGFRDLVSEFLERCDERFDVETAPNAAEGLERLESAAPGCVVSDYDMPGKDGIEFLEAVREEHPDLPFILFTGEGGESVASDAISAGATDYLQKGGGTDQYEILANRVQNAVGQYRSERELERERSRMEFALESVDAAVWTRDMETDAMELNPEKCPVFGVSLESFDEFLAQVHPEDRNRVETTVRSAARAEESYSVQFRFVRDGDVRWGEMNGRTVRERNERFQTGITRDVTARQEQERRFETLVSNLPGMMYRCGTAAGWPMEITRGDVAEFTGYTPSELKSGAVSWGEDVIHPEDRDAVRVAVREALELEEQFELTYRIETKGGETRWVWERGRGVYGPEGDPEAIEGFITDITEREQRGEQRRQNERRFEALFDDPNILVGLLDADGTVLDINETAMRYVEESETAVAGEPFWETSWWRDAEADLQAWIARAAAGEYVEYEAEHPNPSGEPITVEGAIRPVTDASGDVVSLIVSARDITERRRREAELETVRDRLEFALGETGAVVWEANPDTDDLVTHPNFDGLLDADPDTVEGFRERIHSDDRRDLSAALDEAVGTGTSRRVELRTRPDIGTEWIRTRIRPRDGGDSGGRLVGVTRDISDQKRRERRLERQNERFDELARVVSHDLQSPMQAVQGWLEMAAESGDPEHIEKARSAVDRLDELRADLVDTLRSRAVVGETKPLDIGALARDAWERVDSRGGATLTTGDDIRVRGDPDATGRLLQNLLSNAIEHSEGETTVRVGGLENGFYVEDGGPGIDLDDRGTVFKPGFTTKPDGTGMGMASVRQIVEEHGWDIDIGDARTLDGARFEIRV